MDGKAIRAGAIAYAAERGLGPHPGGLTERENDFLACLVAEGVRHVRCVAGTESYDFRVEAQALCEKLGLEMDAYGALPGQVRGDAER